jgi:hypothetical protein
MFDKILITYLMDKLAEFDLNSQDHQHSQICFAG